MATPAGGIPSEVQGGDTVHLAGGMSVAYLTGAFIKSVDRPPAPSFGRTPLAPSRPGRSLSEAVAATTTRSRTQE